MIRTRVLIGCLALLVAGAVPVSAQNQSSTNFQNTDSMIIPAAFDAVSASYIMSATLEMLVGMTISGSYQLEIGGQRDPGVAPTPPPPPPPPGGGGGGGGGGGSPPPPSPTSTPPTPTSTAPGDLPNPTINYIACLYKPEVTLEGTIGTPGAVILVNGSSDGVEYPADNYWRRILPLGLGVNAVFVQAKLGDLVSALLRVDIVRKLVGDVNGDRTVDDVDLSLFTRAWAKNVPEADFNCDGTVDDIDLSLLASHWARSY